MDANTLGYGDVGSVGLCEGGNDLICIIKGTMKFGRPSINVKAILFPKSGYNV
jgi:hypothetical protein